MLLPFVHAVSPGKLSHPIFFYIGRKFQWVKVKRLKIIRADSEMGKKTRQTEKEVGRQPSENVQAWSSPSLRGRWRTEENGGNWM